MEKTLVIILQSYYFPHNLVALLMITRPCWRFWSSTNVWSTCERDFRKSCNILKLSNFGLFILSINLQLRIVHPSFIICNIFIYIVVSHCCHVWVLWLLWISRNVFGIAFVYIETYSYCWLLAPWENIRDFRWKSALKVNFEGKMVFLRNKWASQFQIQR